jgi:predicted ATPase/class 3 adenylate cyclase
MGECAACGRSLDTAAFTFCPWCGTAISANQAIRRKIVTVLFADLVDSTSLGSSLDPEVLASVMNSYWAAARAAVERHGGTVAKYIGDAVVGAFGIPTVHEDDALRAVRAASDLLEEIAQLNVGLRARLGVQLAVRIGINTGETVITDGKVDVSLMVGDVANVGARLEQRAQPGTALLSRETELLVRDAVRTEQTGEFSVKGKEELLTAFRLVSVERPVESPRPRRFSGPMLGRQRQLALALDGYEAACAERCCVLLTIVGIPGVGKTRLVNEFLDRIRRDALILEGRCPPYGEGITFWPLVQALQRVREVRGPSWAAMLAQAEHAEEIAAGLDAILGITAPAGGSHMAWAFRRLLETLALSGPVVLVIDDVQWAQPAFLDVVEHLTELSRDAPILVVAMARPEFLGMRPTWSSGHTQAITMSLSPLNDADSASLTSTLLGVGVDPALLRRITKAAEGVPLFIEEVVAGLSDRGLLVERGDEWRPVSGLHDVVIPSSVHALLSARLDQLTPAQREVLAVASIIGQTFYVEAIEQVLGNGTNVRAEIDSLIRADLLRPTRSDIPGHDAVSFCHLLVRESAYGEIPLAIRAAWHEAVGTWLDGTAVSHLAPEIVASHLVRAASYRYDLGSPDVALSENAAERLMACASRAKNVGDILGASALLVSAANLVPPESTTGIDVMLARVGVAIVSGPYDEAESWAETAETNALATGNVAALWRARLARNAIRRATDPASDMEASIALTERAVQALRETDDQAGLAQAYLQRCEENNYRGRLHEITELARLGTVAALSAADYQLASRLLYFRMYPYYYASATLAEHEAAVTQICSEFGADTNLAHDLIGLQVILRIHQGDLENGVQFLSKQAALAEEQGDPFRADRRRYAISHYLRVAGDFEGAAAALMTTDRLLESIGDTAHRSTTLAELSYSLTVLGRRSEAEDYLERSRRLSHAADTLNEIWHVLTEGLMSSEMRSREAGEERFDECQELIAQTDFIPILGELWLARSATRERHGDVSGAREAATRALSIAEAKGSVCPIEYARGRVAALSQ